MLRIFSGDTTNLQDQSEKFKGMQSSMENDLCIWADISMAEMETLLRSSTNSESIKELLRLKFELGALEDKQVKILLDLYTHVLLLGKKNNYSPAQLSTLLSIMKRLHAECVSTSYENQDKLFTLFQHMMVKHSVNRPPFSLCIFSPFQVQSITDYVLSTYFKHFKLYKYAFTKRLQLNVALDYMDEDGEEDLDDNLKKEQSNIIPEGDTVTASLGAELVEPTHQIGENYFILRFTHRDIRKVHTHG